MTFDGGGHLTVPVSPGDHVLGPDTAPVTLVEYGDYECPYCGAAHPIVQAIVDRLGDDLCYVFRHFPLAQAHPHAQQAAEAAEAAGAQGKFWEVHDLLYEHQTALDGPHLLTYADALGLDVERFASDLASHVHADRVRQDFMSGVRNGVIGTATYLINGPRHDWPHHLRGLLAAITTAAAASPTFIPGGIR